MSNRRRIHNGLRIDVESSKQTMVPHIHAKIHEHQAFQLIVAPVNLGIGADRVMLIQVGATVDFHLDSYSFYADRDSSVEVFDATVPDAPVGGAPFVLDTDIFNKARDTARAPVSDIIDAPSEAGAWVIGNLMDYGQLDVAANAQFSSGQATLGEEEWYLGASENHAIRLTNLDGGNALVGVFKMLFYEEAAD